MNHIANNAIQPEIRNINAKQLIGKQLKMTYAQNKTPELWRSFMPLRKTILNTISNDLFSMQVYPPSFDFNSFNMDAPFIKWAAMEVSGLTVIPEGMDTFKLPGGTYAVFHYKGLNTDTAIFEYIYAKWLPASEYVLDHRPHFEILGEKYKNGDPDSEEEIWIPVRSKD